MPKYKVFLTRVYSVEVDAESKPDAKNIAEFFIGDPSDLSDHRDRSQRKFSIGEMVMALNEAYEADEIQGN